MFKYIKEYYIKLLPDLQEKDWNALQEKLTIQYVKKGEFLTRNGEVCRQVSFINKGILRMYYLVDGKEINMSFVPPFEYLSEYDFCTAKIHFVESDSPAYAYTRLTHEQWCMP